MSRPRIRSVKPEMRQDEKYGRMSRDARELFNGLMTMADDEGRLRAMPSAVLGHVFPYDADAPKKLDGWLGEIVSSGMVLAYEVDGIPYLAFRHWCRHQKIDKPTPSDLPPPPDPEVVADNAPKSRRPRAESSESDRGAGADQSSNGRGVVEDHSGASRAIADRIGSDQDQRPPQPPASGGRARTRVKWEGDALAWARSVGVDGPDASLLSALGQAVPWQANGDAPEAFRAFAAQHFTQSLTVKEDA